MILIAPPRRPTPGSVLAPGVLRRVGQVDGLVWVERHPPASALTHAGLAAIGLGLALLWMGPVLVAGPALSIVEIIAGLTGLALAGAWIAARQRSADQARRATAKIELARRLRRSRAF